MMHCNEVKPIINTPQSGFMKVGMPDDVNDPDLWSVNWIVCGIWFPTLGKTSCKMFRTRPWGERQESRVPDGREVTRLSRNCKFDALGVSFFSSVGDHFQMIWIFKQTRLLIYYVYTLMDYSDVFPRQMPHTNRRKPLVSSHEALLQQELGPAKTKKSAATMARLKSLKTAARKSKVTSKDLCKFWIVLAHPTLKQILDFIKTELILI